MHQNNKIKELTFVAMLITVLFVQEQFLSFLPNIQFTVLLIVVYTKLVGIKKTLFILLIHVILDTTVYGGMLFLYVPFMFLGWALIPIIIGTIFKNNENEIT